MYVNYIALKIINVITLKNFKAKKFKGDNIYKYFEFSEKYILKIDLQKLIIKNTDFSISPKGLFKGFFFCSVLSIIITLISKILILTPLMWLVFKNPGILNFKTVKNLI